MSLPGRIGTCTSAIALVRVKRGSTWKTFAPRSFASITHWKPTGCCSAMLEPMITMQSDCWRSCRKSVAPPRRVDARLRRRALGAQPSARDRRVRIALDLRDLVVLDVHLLATADGAIRADRLHHLVGGPGARRHLRGGARLRRPAKPQRVA